ncbi:hypothetical protein ACELLULO517_21770 [Acidisoma cellulosilytica]|uniref:Uncharacterized protein n=1 Tax=Acidisoma cellulosilyticum TaxID=2802395 RepID=A0A963Z6C6_9PROT|nr:hypothetical protein [Acidisoma cellulosilyticum]MCB8882890.1 hypothetical protein [Acidisoma cellulosilyticum]
MAERAVFEDDKLIGEFAEEAIRAYFEASGFTMHRMGIEHLLPGTIDALHEDLLPDPRVAGHKDAMDQNLELVARLRFLPDFLAISRDLNARGVRDIFPVEVKFRTERDFSADGLTLRTVRLSRKSVAAYRDLWPTTLLVVVCYRGRRIIGTRVRKLVEIPDGRVSIRDSLWRGSWFYSIRSCEFLELPRFRQGCFDADGAKVIVDEVITFAEEVRMSRDFDEI